MSASPRSPRARGALHLGRLALAVLASFVLLFGCGESDVPYEPLPRSGPYQNLENLWINGVYFYFPGGIPTGFAGTAHVVVREEGPKGSVVTGLEVRMEGALLSYDEAAGAYVGLAPVAASGDTVTLSVGNGTDAVSAFVRVPDPPRNFRLRKDYWDVSSPYVWHTLIWENPVTPPSSIAFFLYGETDTVRRQVFWAETNDTEATFFTIYNHDIPYFEMYERMTALVANANLAYFDGNPNNASLAALAAVWMKVSTVR